MTPRSPAVDVRYAAVGHIELRRQRIATLAVCEPLDNLADFCFRKLGTGGILSPEIDTAAPLFAIGYVIRVRSKYQMCRVIASPIVAGVSDNQAIWDFLAISESPSSAMGWFVAPEECDFAIAASVDATLPGPALIWSSYIDLAPEVLFWILDTPRLSEMSTDKANRFASDPALLGAGLRSNGSVATASAVTLAVWNVIVLWVILHSAETLHWSWPSLGLLAQRRGNFMYFNNYTMEVAS